MKAYWLNQQGNENLIVFFSGWSFDENPFKKIDCSDYDILMVYDYNDLKEPLQLNELGGYKSKTLISWSMGVFVAYLLRNLFFDFDYYPLSRVFHLLHLFCHFLTVLLSIR